jgi:hypothetical protein
MAGLKDDAQWIVLMGFIVSFSLFFLAIVINQSTVIGQTTAESVAEFPKNDIRGVREMIIQDTMMDVAYDGGANQSNVKNDTKTLALSRQNSVVAFSHVSSLGYTHCEILFNNGVTVYRETWSYRE